LKNKGQILLGIFAVALLVAMVWKLLAGSEYIDIPFGDDSMYLFFSRFMQEKIFPDYGPMYVGTLKVFTLFTGDIIETSIKARIFHLIIPAIALIYLSIRYRIGWGLTALLVVAFLSSPWVADFGFFRPLISHPALAIILAWTGWVKDKSLKQIWLSAILLMLVIMYYRPEQILGFLMALALSAVLMIYKWKKQEWSKRTVSAFVLIYFFAIIIIMLVGKPIGAGGKRSGLAILQHVSLNYLQEEGDINAWQNHVYFMDYLPKMFGMSGKIKSMPTDADILFQKGKPLLLMHFRRNVIQYANNWLYMGHVIMPYGTPIILSYIFSIIIFVVFIFHRKKGTVSKEKLSVMIILLLCIITITATSILIYPRVHYFLFALPFFYFMCMEVLNSNRRIVDNIMFQYGALIMAFCYFLLMPSMYSKPLEKLGGADNKLTHIPAIRTLWTLNINDTVGILDRDMGLVLYMPRNYKLTDFNMDTTFIPFIMQKDMKVIYYNHTLRNDRHFALDTTFQNFVKEGYKNKYNKIPIPNTEDTFIVAKELLH